MSGISTNVGATPRGCPDSDFHGCEGQNSGQGRHGGLPLPPGRPDHPPDPLSPHLDRLIQLALDEDLGPGDITTDSLVSPDAMGRGTILAKESLLLAGLPVARRVFSRVDPEIVWEPVRADGDRLEPGETAMTVRGRLRSLLIGERTALNFLQRLSGIATHVRKHVDAVASAGKNVRLVDTRKTTPGWRSLEKYAVRIGGAANHRFGLFDGVLIKDNHLAVCGGVERAVALARERVHHLVRIEVEVEDMAGVRQALNAGADAILLDNMSIDQIREAVGTIQDRALIEVSGGVTLETLPALAQTGVDLISCGALTHGARSVDLSMDIVAED
ncbi:MAG: carboxylating nicotinate-nucleotide diphosphorylase [Desulfococcaceae bacterium]